jgi:hypothetical protein
MNSKQQYLTYLVVSFVLVFGIILAFQFITSGNETVITKGINSTTIVGDKEKVYDVSTQTVTLKEAEGTKGTILTTKLDTPHTNLVSIGYQKFAQVTCNSNNLTECIPSFEFYNKSNGDKQIFKQVDIKFLTYEKEEVNDTECIDYKNIPCDRKVVGKHLENKEVWNNIKDINKIEGNVTLGFFTNIEVGDKIEWIPSYNIDGTIIKVSEWALVYQAVVFPTDTGTECTTKCGVRIGVNTTSRIVNVTKYTASPQTEAYVSIRTGTGIDASNLIATATFVSTTATFSPAVEINSSYDYYVWGNGGTGMRIASVTFPVYSADIYVKNSARDGNEFTGQVEGIKSIYTSTGADYACNFSGYVKDSSGNGLNGAEIIIFNQNNKAELYNLTSASTGYWSKNITNSTKNYTAVAYYNNTLVGIAKPYISGYC